MHALLDGSPLQKGAHDAGNGSQQAAGAEGEVGARVGGRAGVAGAARAGGDAGGAGVVRGRRRGGAGRCLGGAAGGGGRVGGGVLAGKSAELRDLALSGGRAGVVGAVVVAAGLHGQPGCSGIFFFRSLFSWERSKKEMGNSRRDGLIRGTLASVILAATVLLAGLCAAQAVLHDVVGFAGGRGGSGCCGGGLGQDSGGSQEGDEGDKGLHLVCYVWWFEAGGIMFVNVQAGLLLCSTMQVLKPGVMLEC